MGKRYAMSEGQVEELEAARKRNRNKSIEKRLKALTMFAKGSNCEEISKQTGYAVTYISKIVGKYVKSGLNAVAGNNYRGNRRNMSFAEEEALLSAYKARAEQGEMIDVGEIEIAYAEKVSHPIGSGQIYRMLRRHGWRKVMPRSQHPNKASDEVIEASKKLTLRSQRKRTNVWTVESV